MGNNDRQLYEFGPFRMDPEHRQLLRQNQPIPLQPKAFDILLVLVKNSENVVLKDDLLKTVWPETFVEESNLAQNIFVLRKTLGDAVEEKRYIVTVPGRGYRFAEKVRIVHDGHDEDQLVVESHSRSRMVIEEKGAAVVKTLPAKRWDLRKAIVPTLVIAIIAVGAGYFYTHRGPKLTSKDAIVIADFTNSSGDPVFDGTLKQALSLQLEQSPFLNLLSDQRVAQTLSRMDQPKDARLTRDLAREVCQRTASAAVLDGTIAQFDKQYLLTLEATDCSSGDSLASAEARAVDKNHVLDALGKVAAEVRKRLGESLSSVQQYDVNPEDVTTPSLDALKAYSLGMQERKFDIAPATSLFQRAIDLDPNFAMAYAQLGVIFFNLDDTEKAADNVRKAYELREHVSEREKFYIASHYEDMVTRNLEASRKIYQVWQQVYPRDGVPFGNLGTDDIYLGDWDENLIMSAKSAELAQRKYDLNVISSYVYLDRIDEAKKMAVAAQSSDLASPWFDLSLYAIAFLQRDQAGMDREAAQLIGKPALENAMLYGEANTAAYSGHFSKARELTERAVSSAEKIDNKALAAAYHADAALREALIGNSVLAQQESKTALAESKTREVEAIAAVALAESGKADEALRLADDLAKKYPQDTIVHANFLPTTRAIAALHAKNPAKAIEALQAASPYELGYADLDLGFALYPVYVRGEAYLMAKQGSAAAAEFQKIVGHPGIVGNEVIGALAHLEMGRAYSLSGDANKAKQQYQEFLTLWKDGDAEAPILKQAKQEYAKLGGEQ